MKFFIDASGKQVSVHDHVLLGNRRGIVVSIQHIDEEATIWFYDTRESEYVKFTNLVRPSY